MLSSFIGFNNEVAADGVELVTSGARTPSSTQEFLFLEFVWENETFWEFMMFSLMFIGEGLDV